MDKVIGLCYRCESRARFHEEGHAPRMQCGDPGSVYSCYMYRPVSPVVFKRAKGDRRPVGGPSFIASRIDGVAIAKGENILERKGRGKYIIYWKPK